MLIEFSTAKGKLILALALIASLGLCWVGIRDQLGSMLASVTPPGAEGAADVARNARWLAPTDPMTKWLEATVARQVFSPESTENSTRAFEDAVRLSPYDYRLWLEAGRAYEQAAKYDKAELAITRAVELAPLYAYPQWQYGNFLLRRDRYDEAKTHLRLATRRNHPYREQVFSLAWDLFDKDPSKVEELAYDEPDVLTGLTLFYAARGQAAEALRAWVRLDDAERARNPQITAAIAQGLYDRRYFAEALEFSRQIGSDAESAPETVTNAGFEKLVPGGADAGFFNWKLSRTDGKIDISQDGSVKHSGSRSLKIGFKGYTKPDLYAAGQTVVVAPGRSYRLTAWVRTENLRSAGGPQLEVVNARDDRILATKALPQGTNDWQEIYLDIVVPGDSTGITIRTARGFCDGCPITGTLWYDDVALSKR